MKEDVQGERCVSRKPRLDTGRKGYTRPFPRGVTGICHTSFVTVLLLSLQLPSVTSILYYRLHHPRCRPHRRAIFAGNDRDVPPLCLLLRRQKLDVVSFFSISYV